MRASIWAVTATRMSGSANLDSLFSFSITLLGTEKAATAPLPAAQEFPVLLEQSLAAGKTPVGTKIQARLAVATLVAGTVIPRNAVFSGEVSRIGRED